MRIFKVALFEKWARRRVSNSELAAVVHELEKGLVGDQLGANLYKKRIALRGRGKRGGARVLLTYKSQERTFFLFGY